MDQIDESNKHNREGFDDASTTSAIHSSSTVERGQDISICTNSDNVRRLMIVGLEGVGKTTFINAACNTQFAVSDGKDGCKLSTEQVGSFTVKSEKGDMCIKLLDTIGMNCTDPGEWQKHLNGKSQLNGIIFYINASNPRTSALGDLPRFAEYCKNLTIPTVVLYRDGEPKNFPEIQHSTEIVSNFNHKIKEVHYENMDNVKQEITNFFQQHTKSHILLDPVALGTRIQNLERSIRDLQSSNEELNQKNEKLEKKNMTLNSKCIQIADDYKKAIHKFTSEIKELHNKLEKLRGENLTLHRNITKMEHQNETLQKMNYELMANKHTLQEENKDLTNAKNVLTDWKRVTAQKIRSIIDDLNRNQHRVSVASGEIRRVKTKRYSGSYLLALLPFYGYHVIRSYDHLAEDIANLINTLKEKLDEIENINC